MSEGKTDSPTPDSLTKDTIFDLLSKERRRHVLSCLTDHESLALPNLADEVASRESNPALSQIPEEDILSIYLSLYHQHIPKLEEANVVVYDQDLDRVALTENADLLRQHSSLESTK